MHRGIFEKDVDSPLYPICRSYMQCGFGEMFDDSCKCR